MDINKITKYLSKIEKKENNLITNAIIAYIYGYPIVANSIIEATSIVNGSKINTFTNVPTTLTPSFTNVSGPNVDTLYSNAWVDLSKEPLVLHIPNTQNRYYLLEILDPWGNIVTSIGKRTIGSNGKNFIIVGPNYKGTVPSSMTKITSPTNTLWIRGYFQQNSKSNYEFVNSMQSRLYLTPLNVYNPRYFKASSKFQGNSKNISTQPFNQIKLMNAKAYYTLMLKAICKNPAYPSIKDQSITETLISLGLIPSPSFDYSALSIDIQIALEKSMSLGPLVLDYITDENNIENTINEWVINFNRVESYKTDYIQRATIAKLGIGPHTPRDIAYGIATKDSLNGILDGNNAYVIHFSKDQLPPANAFWSLTLYDTQFHLVSNSINRHTISSHIERLNYNPDNSLDIYVYSKTSHNLKHHNWLPAPTSPFILILRLFSPKNIVLTNNWLLPSITKI